MTSSSDMPRVLQYNADFAGCGFWRMLWPQLILNMKKKAVIWHSHLYIRDMLQYSFVNAVHLQRQGTQHQAAFIRKLSELKQRLNFRLLYDVDDVLLIEDVPKYNYSYEKLLKANYRDSIVEAMELCDELIVSTPFLKDYYGKKTKQKNISVIPNSPPISWIGHFYSEELLLRNYHKHRKKPRILYSGSPSHFCQAKRKEDLLDDDFAHVKDAILKTLDKYRWVFVGGMPVEFSLLHSQDKIEYISWRSMDEYPKILSSLEINMAVAPLQVNTFNSGKSDLKFLEASALGLPVACQDMVTYAVAPIRFKTGEDMLDRIEETLATEERFLAASRKGRRLVDTRWLEREENYGKYLDIYTQEYGSPNRRYFS